MEKNKKFVPMGIIKNTQPELFKYMIEQFISIIKNSPKHIQEDAFYDVTANLNIESSTLAHDLKQRLKIKKKKLNNVNDYLNKIGIKLVFDSNCQIIAFEYNTKYERYDQYYRKRYIGTTKTLYNGKYK